MDGTQSIGALPLSVRALAPDYLTCSAYKWLLCPYGLAFLYVAPHRQEGRPLEDHYFHRLNAAGHEGHLDHINAYAPGARRFDMGERSNFIILPMAITALRQLLDWSVPEIGWRIGLIAGSILAGAASLGYHAASKDRQATHLFGLRRRGGLPSDLAMRLHAANVFVPSAAMRFASVRTCTIPKQTSRSFSRRCAPAGNNLRAVTVRERDHDG